jgi:hypothetical protein
MKKIIIAVILAALIAAVSPVFAQTIKEENSSEYYYVNVLLEKIYPYRTGYVLQYRKGLNQIDRLYVPLEWFTGTAGKGELVTLASGRSWPSLTVYYKNGEFSHIRLYVHHVTSHESWGTIPQNVNIDSRFENVDELKIKFR